MTKNLNCLNCHKPMHEGEDYYACHNDECFYVDVTIKKYAWNTRHDPLQDKVGEFRKYMVEHYHRDNIALKEFNRIFGKDEK